jgi:carbonic anhydrase
MSEFCTAINCMDGRVQAPVLAFLRERCGAPFVDTITEPGPNLILAEQDDALVLESVLRRIDISVGHHGSRHIALVGHHDCTGNPAAHEVQVRQLGDGVRWLRERYPDAEVIGLWVNEQWQVEELSLS